MTTSSCCSTGSGLTAQVRTLLCSILSVLQTLTQVARLYAKIDYSAVAATLTLALDDTHRKLGITIDNRTNQAVNVSFDGVNIHDCVASGATREMVYGPSMRYEINKVYLSYVSAPSSGWVTITAWY